MTTSLMPPTTQPAERRFHRDQVTPDRSMAQRLDALERANAVRTFRRDLKRDLKAGRVSIIALLTDPPDEVLTMKLLDLLLAAPRYGRVKATKTLNRCRVSPTKTVGGLSPRQRGELVAMLRGG